MSLFALAAAPASADTIVNFTVTGSFDGGDFIFAPGSTITIDTTTGKAITSSLSITGVGDVFTSQPNVLNSQLAYGWLGSQFDVLGLGTLPSFVGFTGGFVGATLDGLSIGINFSDGSGIYLADPPSPTTQAPEPDSIFLLGMGLAGLIGFASLRRNLA